LCVVEELFSDKLEQNRRKEIKEGVRKCIYINIFVAASHRNCDDENYDSKNT
jgi:hypothetical protein